MGQELQHHGILGQRWGIRRYQNSDGTLTTAGKQRYSDEDRKRNGQELNNAIERSRSHRDTGRPSAKEVWETSSTMKQFYENTKKDYQKRNAIYDGKRKLPKEFQSERFNMFNDDEKVYYGYGEKFESLMKKKATELVYDEKDVAQIMRLVEYADWNDINKETYHDKAWLYWH